MTPGRWFVAITALACLLLGATGDFGRAANPTNIDLRQDAGAGTPSMSGFGPGADSPTEALLSGNPLWAIPLNLLKATRERPIFLPSRRPPAPATVPAAATAPPPPPTKPAPAPEAERPALTLVGVVSGVDDGFAVFVNTTTRDIVRLRTGEGYEGWILRSVKGREAVLENNRRNVVIEMPPPSGDRK